MNKYYHIFTLFGIPVGVSPWFLLLLAFLSFNMGDWVQCLIFAVCVCIALLVHEFGHALTATHFNFKAKIVLTGMGGATLHGLTTSRQSFFITLMGPLSGLLLAGIGYGTLWLLSQFANEFIATHIYLAAFLTYTFLVNLVWSIFNLLPIYPMDGGKILSSILDHFFDPRKSLKITTVIGIIGCVGLLGYFALQKNIFMIFIAFYMLLININGIKYAFGSDDTRKNEAASLQAEQIYELGRNAAREHRWKELEMFGYRLKEIATTEDQIRRAYDFLTIANTNTFRYKEALEFSKHASDSDAIRQAVERCHRVLEQENTND